MVSGFFLFPLIVDPLIRKIGCCAHAMASNFDERISILGEKSVARAVVVKKREKEFVRVGKRLSIQFRSAADVNFLRVLIRGDFKCFVERMDDGNTVVAIRGVARDDDIETAGKRFPEQGDDRRKRLPSHDNRVTHRQFLESFEIIGYVKENLVVFSDRTGTRTDPGHNYHRYFLIHGLIMPREFQYVAFRPVPAFAVYCR